MILYKKPSGPFFEKVQPVITYERSKVQNIWVIFMSNGIAIFMSIAIAIYGNEGKDDDMGEY